MLDAATKSGPSNAVPNKIPVSTLPDVSKWRDKPFVANPKDPSNWRLDPTTGKPISLKGPGWLGALKVPGKPDTATEYSVGIEINGKEVDVPSLVPTLTTQEVQQTLEAASKGIMPPDSVIRKATEFAAQRIAAGKSPFAGPGDAPQ